jgi:hypothetical protein
MLRVKEPTPMKKEELWNGLSHVAVNPAAPDDDFKCWFTSKEWLVHYGISCSHFHYSELYNSHTKNI